MKPKGFSLMVEFKGTALKMSIRSQATPTNYNS